jgi:hypothetical protein
MLANMDILDFSSITPEFITVEHVLLIIMSLDRLSDSITYFCTPVSIYAKNNLIGLLCGVVRVPW